ncbi:MAG: YkvA family protein [Capnocytophaga sp.]|nr:YkvA family protein [Capnocytophaga sp.]
MFDKKDAQREFDKERGGFSQEKLQEVLGKEPELQNRFSKNRPMNQYFNDFKLFFSLLKDYFAGRYKNVPWRTIAAIGGTLIYVLSPVDFIPDIIPILGFTDDAAVFAFCLKMVAGDIQEYREWKQSQQIVTVR